MVGVASLINGDIEAGVAAIISGITVIYGRSVATERIGS